MMAAWHNKKDKLFGKDNSFGGKEFTYIGLPLKLENGDGSPIRAVAVLKDED